MQLKVSYDMFMFVTASQSDWSEEEEPLAAQWADSLPPHLLDSLDLSATLRKRQEVIHGECNDHHPSEYRGIFL